MVNTWGRVSCSAIPPQVMCMYSKEYHKSYYESNREERVNYQKKYRMGNLEAISKYHKEYYNKNKLKLDAKTVVWQRDNRDKIKRRAVDYLGGRCSKCGYYKCLKALEFHHVRGSKSFTISQYKINKLNWDVVFEELDKCILLCANCHREETYK